MLLMDIKNWSIRKGCYHCRQPLNTFKEKITRTCSVCAGRALEGFQEMSEGHFKSGFKKVIGDKTPAQEALIKSSLKRGLSKRKSLEKRLRRKGLSEEEIKTGLEEFDKNVV